MKGGVKSGLARSLFSSGIGPLLSQILAFMLIPFLFRLYTPRDFGVWAAVQSIAIIAGSLVSLRFDLALVLERKIEAASQLFFAIIGVVSCSSIVVGFVIVVLREVLESSGLDGPTLALGWCWLFFVGLSVVFQGWLMRGGAFGAISVAMLLNAIVTNIVQFAGSTSGRGIWLIVGSVSGQAAALALFFLVTISTTERPRWRWMSFDEMLASLKQNRRFPQFSLPFTALSLLRERAPIFIIGAFGPTALVGLYSQAWRLTHFPSGLTSAALRPVFFHRTATEGLAAQGESVDRFVRWLLLASSPWMGFVVFGNDALFSLLLGDQWLGAGRLAAILVLPAALFAITNWMDRLLDAVGRQDVNLKVESVAGLTSIGALWVTLAAGKSLATAVLLQSVALAVTYVAFIWTCYRIAGWPRSGLVASLCAASAVGILTYLFLVLLGTLFSQIIVFVSGAAYAVLITIVVLMMAWKNLQ